jgi:hypothetical protein
MSPSRARVQAPSILSWKVAKSRKGSSTAIADYRHDDARKILTVWFTDGSVYRYFEVSRATFDGLGNAPSRGGYFNLCVRSKRSECIKGPD